MTYSILVKTWVPAKKRKLKSGKVVDVKGYYDPRSPKRGYMVANDNWVMASKNRDDWEIPISNAISIVSPSLSVKEMRAQAARYANNNIRGKFINYESKWTINVGRGGIDKTLSHGLNHNQFDALSAIPELLRHGAISRISEPGKDKHKGAVDAFWYMYAPIRLSGKLYIAKLVIKSGNDGYAFYDLDLSKEIDGESLLMAPRKKRVAANKKSSPSVFMIADINRYVNDDGGVLKKSHSILVRKKNTSPL